MLKSDLLEIIANGENSSVEFKRDDVRPEQLAKEIVALANLNGGLILLGVDDSGTIVGTSRQDLEAWVMDTVLGKYIHPMILPVYEEVVVESGKRVGIISLTQGTTKPYVVRKNGGEFIYIRLGSTTRQATREQQMRLFQTGGLLHTEILPVSGTSLRDLSVARLEDYLLNLFGEREVPTDDLGWEQRLEGLGWVAKQPGGHHVCTVSGLILFGRAPHRYLPQAGIRWMAFAGDSMEYQSLDDALLDGPLVGLFQGSVGGGRERIETGLIERFEERAKPFLSTDVPTVESMRRERRWHYPLEALREAIMNALVHRDWTRMPEVEVVAYSDRIEIKSPGSLVNSMTVEKMIAGQRVPRNPHLTEVMRDYGYVDARGMGVRRKIVPLVRAATGEDARFEATEDYVRVIMPRSAKES